jgi:hypothetical protein
MWEKKAQVAFKRVQTGYGLTADVRTCTGPLMSLGVGAKILVQLDHITLATGG